MAPSLAVPEGWKKLPCQAAVETPQKATRHGSDEETHVSEGDTSIGIQDIEQTLAPKVRDQEGAPVRLPFLLRPFLTKSFLRGRSQTLDVGGVLHEFRACFQRWPDFSGRGEFDPSIFRVPELARAAQ